MGQVKYCVSSILVAAFLFLLHDNGYVFAQGHNQPDEPEFLEPLKNLTVSQGRDISFTCVINNLGKYRTAWIKSDSKAILSIHTHMITVNPRTSVSRDGHNTWKLHISNVQLSDSGIYVCQVNTDPMKSLIGYLDVVVPPDILDHTEQNLEEGIRNEGGNITLICRATGVPKPIVQWYREGGEVFILRKETGEVQVTNSSEGEKLVLTNVRKMHMGAYFCIVSNGVPPSVSKRFDVRVNIPPAIKAIKQLVGANKTEVKLECIVEGYPKPLNRWNSSDGDLKLQNSSKYIISEAMINLYTWHLNLTIRHLTEADSGRYSCSSENALTGSEATVQLHDFKLHSGTLRTKPIYNASTTPEPHQNQPSNYNKGINENKLPPNKIQENEIHGDENETDVHTQRSTRICSARSLPPDPSKCTYIFNGAGQLHLPILPLLLLFFLYS